ncbi:hypothetical protein G7Y89_g891 [Cudoniella acicularis]|uniref:Uncharacterized protein n=1 Tax=Cudoniella acicularis TaxID=354080 RepID=A0A8H4RWB6_9HELO|nr:hypothetical protein G7Y89_g891 [Cudoniella acicularis]
MEASAVIEALQPIAEICSEVFDTSTELSLIIQNIRQGDLKSWLAKHIAALSRLAPSSENFPSIYVPSIFDTALKNIRLEAAALLEPLPKVQRRLGSYLNDNWSIEENQTFRTELKALVNRPFKKIHIPTILHFRNMCRKNENRGWHDWWKYQFHLDTSIPGQKNNLTRSWLGEERIKCVVAMKPEANQSLQTWKDLKEVLPLGAEEGKFGEGVNRMGRREWVVGLNCEEREILVLTPFVADVVPWQPVFDMSLAFD